MAAVTVGDLVEPAADSQGSSSGAQSNGENFVSRALRRSQQDYVGSFSCLPETTWQAMACAGTPRQRAECLATHLYGWGLRLPTEGTLATLTAVISLFQANVADFELHTNLQLVRSVWKSLAKRQGTDLSADRWISVWPEDLETLPPYVRESLAQAPPQVPLPVSFEQISMLSKRVPLRQTHSSVVHAKQEQNLISALRRIRSLQGFSLEDVGGLKNLMIFPFEEKKGRPSTIHNALTDEALESQRGPGLGRPAPPVPASGARQGGSAPAPLPEERKEPESFCQVCLREGEEGSQVEGAFVCSQCQAEEKQEPSKEEAVKSNALEVAAQALFEKRQGDKVKKRPAAAKGKAQIPKKLPAELPAPAGGDGAETAAAAKAKTSERKTKAKEPAPSEDLAGGEKKPKGTQPAASAEPVSKRRKKEKPEEIFSNFTFNATHHGKCKVEFYTEKSYVRKWCLEQEKWVMLVGSTDKKWHKHVCKRLVADVTRGLDRAALKEARDRYIEQMGA